MNRVLSYLNPVNRLGKRGYSLFFPLLTVLTVFALIEFVVYYVLKDPMAVGASAIFSAIALILYFSFRDGLKGGITAVVLTIAYYFYIIYTREYKGDLLKSGLETTAVLGVLYFFLAGVIGWLKQAIDGLIEREADEKRRFQAIVQQLPVGVILTDQDGRINFANKRANSILGTKVPIGFNVGDGFFVKVLNTKNYPLSQSLLARALANGKSIVKDELAIERENGRMTYVEVSASSIKNRHGKIIAGAEIVSDVTGQKEQEKRKDDFVNMASHELKTPITSMMLYLDAILKNYKNYDQEKIIKMIRTVRYQTERLQKLVGDLLDVSRLQTGKLSFRKERFNLSSIIAEAVLELQSVVPEKKLNFSPRNGMWVDADEFRIQQVLTNLITNAVKYSPDEEDIIIRINKKNGKIITSVKDTGIGIAREQQKKIFERLYQVANDKEKTFPGLGMGLYISKEIVKRHRGQIWVESEKGKGSTFFFSLPGSK